MAGGRDPPWLLTQDVSLKGGTVPQGASAAKEGPGNADREVRASWSRAFSAKCLQVQHIPLRAGQESKETEDLVAAMWLKEYLESHMQAEAKSQNTN